MKKPVRWILIFLAALVLLLVTAGLLVQTQVAKAYLARKLTQVLSAAPDRKVVIEGISGWIPVDMRLSHVALSDRNGLWLELQNARLEWSPSRLFQGKIRIDELQAEAIRVNRLPAASRQPAEGGKEKNAPLDLGRIPPVEMQHLAIKRIYVGNAVFGRKAVFSLKGKLTTDRAFSRAQALVRIERIDQGPRTTFRTEAMWTQSSAALNLKLHFQEDPAGLIAALVQLNDAGAIRLDLDGEGPLNAWQGRLTGFVERFGRLDTGVKLRLTPPFAIALRGHSQPATALIPKELVGLLGSRQSFHIQAKTKDFKRITVEGLRLQGSGGQLAIKGEVSLEDKRFETKVKARINRLKLLQPLVGNKIGGRAKLAGSLRGTFDSPEGSLELKLSDAAWNDVQLSSANLRLTAEAEAQSTLARPRYRLKSDGDLEIRRLPNMDIPPEKRLNWQIDLEWLEGTQLTIHQLTITGEHLQAEAGGSLDVNAQTGRLQARLNADSIKTLAALAGQDLDGNARFQLTAEKESGNDPYRITFGFHAGELTEIKAVPSELLGKEIDMNGTVLFLPGRRVDIRHLKLKNDFLDAETQADIDLSRKTMQGKVHLDIADLRPAGELAGKPLSGTLSLDASASGPWNRFAIEAKLTGHHLTYDKAAYDEATVNLRGRNLPAEPQGDLSVLLAMGRDRLKAKTAFKYQKEQLALNGLTVTAPGCTIQGDVQIDVKQQRAQGALNGKLPDLAGLGRLFGQDLAGSAVFSTHLKHKGGRQEIELDATVRKLRFSNLSLQHLSINGDIKDLPSRPKGRLLIEAQGFESGKTKLHALSARLDGNPQSVSYRLKLDGRYQSPLSLQSRGNLSFAGSAKLVRLQDLQGRYAKVPFKLLQPLDLRFDNDSLSIDHLQLKAGTGQMKGSARWNSRSVTAHLGISRMPLRPLEELGIWGISGTCDMDIKASGSSSHPTIAVDAHVGDLRYRAPDMAPLPPADIRINASLKADRLKARLKVTGVSEQPLTAQCSVPVSLSLVPARLTVPVKDPLEGRLQGRLKLGSATRIFLPEDQVLEGLFGVHATLAGTVAQPRFSGDLSLSDGRYENLNTGILLHNITAKASLTDKRLIIERLTADTPNQGKLKMQGSMELASEKHFPLQVRTQLSRALLMQSDMASVTADGELKAEGTLRSMQTEGRLVLEPVEVHIPEQVGPDVPDLKVTEINKPGGPPEDETSHGMPMKLALHIDLDFPNRLFVRGRGLDSEWHGRLKLRGTVDQPIITGNIDFLRGHLDFLTKRMNLENSTIQFTGATPPDPILGIKAESSVDDTKVRIVVTGPASDPEIKMESEPALPEDEILSRLLFGKSVEKISATQALQLALAVRTLAGKGSAGLLDRTRNLLGVDSLDINTADGASSTFGIGKQLTDDIHVGYKTGTGREKSGKVTVEVDVLPNLSVSSEISNRGNTGFGVNWKYDY